MVHPSYSVYVDYTVVAPNTNMHLLSGQLAAESLKDTCTQDMQSNGYANAQMLENPTIADLSPTAAPTVNPHYPTMAPTINPKCGEKVVVLFTQRIDNVNIMQASNEAFIREFMAAVSTGSGVPAEEITYLSQNPAKYGVAVDMVFQIETTTTEFPDGDALIATMQGKLLHTPPPLSLSFSKQLLTPRGLSSHFIVIIPSQHSPSLIPYTLSPHIPSHLNHPLTSLTLSIQFN